MTGTYINDRMREAIGRVYEHLTSYPVSVSDIRRWVLATYYPDVPPREYWDDEYASRASGRGILAPHEFNPFAWMNQEPKGVPARIYATSVNRVEELLDIPSPNLEHALNGGIEVEYFARMFPGDVIISETALESYAEKRGSLGVMLLTRTRSTWRKESGELVKHMRKTMIRY